MDNAVQYSPPGGRIAVSLQLAEKSAVLSIQNACENLPAEDPEKLFDRFYGETARERRNQAAMGSAFQRRETIAELYRGAITARYEGKDRIIFTVRLPSV